MTEVISGQLKVLAELQKIDYEIHELRSDMAHIPVDRKANEAEFEKKKTSLKTAEEALKSAQLNQKKKEGDLAAAEEKVKKLSSQLYSLKSNKEYQAMEMEIKGLKADKSLIEDEILKSFDAVEAAKAKVAEERTALGVHEKSFNAKQAELAKKESELGAQVSALEDKRKTLSPSADPKLLAQYERILKSRDGLALVPVKNGSCGGCHNKLPAQLVNEVQMQDKIHICESCARILYWPA